MRGVAVVVGLLLSGCTAGDGLEAVPGEGASVVFLGDSWTEGYAATPPTNGYAYEVADTMGWDARVVPGGGGTGYLTGGPADTGTYGERLEEQPADESVDVLVIQGGLNDAPVDGSDSTVFDDAAESVIRLGEEKYPNAVVVVVGPLDPESSDAWVSIAAVDERLADVTDALDVRYVSPTRERWFATEADVARYVDASKAHHPNTAGHAYFADRLADELRQTAR